MSGAGRVQTPVDEAFLYGAPDGTVLRTRYHAEDAQRTYDRHQAKGAA